MGSAVKAIALILIIVVGGYFFLQQPVSAQIKIPPLVTHTEPSPINSLSTFDIDVNYDYVIPDWLAPYADQALPYFNYRELLIKDKKITLDQWTDNSYWKTAKVGYTNATGWCKLSIIADTTDMVFRISTEMTTWFTEYVSSQFTVAISGEVQPSVSIMVSSTNIQVGDTVSFTSDVRGITSPIYQWYKDSSPIATATSNTYSEMLNVVGQPMFYLMVNALYQSNIIIIDVTSTPPPVGTVVIQVFPLTLVITGTQISFTSTITNIASPIYQWYKDSSAILGATLSTYQETMSTEGTFTFYLMVNTVQSNILTIIVSPPVQTPDFSIELSTSTLVAPIGSPKTMIVYFAGLNEFSDTVDIVATSNNPSFVTCVIQSSVSISGTARIPVTATLTTLQLISPSATITFLCTSGTLSHQQILTVITQDVSPLISTTGFDSTVLDSSNLDVKLAFSITNNYHAITKVTVANIPTVFGKATTVYNGITVSIGTSGEYIYTVPSITTQTFQVADIVLTKGTAVSQTYLFTLMFYITASGVIVPYFTQYSCTITVSSGDTPIATMNVILQTTSGKSPDVTGDGMITDADYNAVIPHIGHKSTSVCWDICQAFDFDNSGVITVIDMQYVQTKVGVMSDVYVDGIKKGSYLTPWTGCTQPTITTTIGSHTLKIVVDPLGISRYFAETKDVTATYVWTVQESSLLSGGGLSFLGFDVGFNLKTLLFSVTLIASVLLVYVLAEKKMKSLMKNK